MILDLDEAYIADLDTGQRGRLIVTAMPDNVFEFSVTQITAVAQTREGRTTFRVEATLDQGSPRLRPGMKGVAKVEAGERPEETLIRELKEGLGIAVNEACLAPLTFASHGYPDFHLLMPLYVCRRWEGTVTALEGQRLAWVRPNRLRDYPMPPADEPLVSHLTTLL